MQAILKASAALIFGAALLASGGASAQQMLASRNCSNGDTIRMVIARDAVVVERRSGFGAPTAVQAFDMWNFRAAQSAFNSSCY